MKRAIVGLGFGVALLLASCGDDGFREGCHAYCLTDDTGLPPNRVSCLDENARSCGTVLTCADGTAISVDLCTTDGPRCADGSEPVCSSGGAADGG
jgi:hypothetical protein